jgi:GNAT superfamily N-acetyltransferase
MITIRRAIEADAETMSKIVIASVRDLCVADHKNDPALVASWTANKTPENFRSWVAAAETVFLMAERDGEAVGVGGVSLDGTIRLLYVAPARRAQGVSRALLVYMESLLRDAGLTTGRLVSSETALQCYLSAGWVDDECLDETSGAGGHPMLKELGRAGA